MSKLNVEVMRIEYPSFAGAPRVESWAVLVGREQVMADGKTRLEPVMEVAQGTDRRTVLFDAADKLREIARQIERAL